MRSTIVPITCLFIAMAFYEHIFAVADSSLVHITISDTGCDCRTYSQQVFNCRRFITSIQQSQKGSRHSPSIQKMWQNTKRFIDSLGFIDVHTSNTAHGIAVFFPGIRSVLVGEELVFTHERSDFLPELENTLRFPRFFNAAEIKERTAFVARAFMCRGFPYARVMTDFQPSLSADSCTVVFTVDTDTLYHFAPPRLKGTFSLRKEVLQHDITIVPGRFFSLETIEQSVQHLRSRWYISSVTVEEPEIIIDTTSNKSGKRTVSIPFVINDYSGLGLDGAVGFEVRENEQLQLQGNGEFTFNNIFGFGEAAALSYSGDRTMQRMDLECTVPWCMGYPVQASVSGGLEIEKEQYGFLYGRFSAFYETGLAWWLGIRVEGNTTTGSNEDGLYDGSYTGVDLVVKRDHEPLSDGSVSRYMYLATGGGITHKNRRYTRSHIDFSAMMHVPLVSHQAFLIRGNTGHLITRQEKMLPTELYRVGGYQSCRGYGENEFAFRTVLYGQTEYLYYVQKDASVYLLCDGGIGFSGDITRNRSYIKMLGYGVGVRLPLALGVFSIAWARNISDHKSPGRIHVRLQNPVSVRYRRGGVLKN